MFLMRLIVLLLVVAVLLWLLKRLFSPDSDPDKPLATQSENMRQCKYCGIHVPESSILSVDGKPYCSAEHADLDQQ